MAPYVFMTDHVNGACAIYDEAPGGGDFDDINAPRNAPLIDPDNHLDLLRFHSDLDYLEVSHGPTDVAINHASVPAVPAPSGYLRMNSVMSYGGYSATHVLLTHNLGYVPDFMVVVDGDILYGGKPVQYEAGGRTRHVAVYATTTQILLREWAIRTLSAISAVAKTYTVLVFRQPPAPVGNIALDFDPDTAVTEMGYGKFNSDRRYLQIRPGGSPFGFALGGRSIDLANGAPRLIDVDGTITDIVPASMQLAFAGSFQTTGINYGPSGAYNGSYTGAPSIQVQAP